MSSPSTPERRVAANSAAPEEPSCLPSSFHGTQIGDNPPLPHSATGLDLVIPLSSPPQREPSESSVPSESESSASTTVQSLEERIANLREEVSKPKKMVAGLQELVIELCDKADVIGPAYWRIRNESV